jgi:hypothetical protein
VAPAWFDWRACRTAKIRETTVKAESLERVFIRAPKEEKDGGSESDARNSGWISREGCSAFDNTQRQARILKILPSIKLYGYPILTGILGACGRTKGRYLLTCLQFIHHTSVDDGRWLPSTYVGSGKQCCLCAKCDEKNNKSKACRLKRLSQRIG